jgi:hypothetical protein
MGSFGFFFDLALVDSASNTKPGISLGVKGGRCLSRPLIEFLYLSLHVTWTYFLVSLDLQDLQPKMLLVMISSFMLHIPVPPHVYSFNFQGTLRALKLMEAPHYAVFFSLVLEPLFYPQTLSDAPCSQISLPGYVAQ